MHTLLGRKSIIKVVDSALLRRLRSLRHDLDRLIKVIIAKLKLGPFNPHLRQFLDRLERHSHSLLHDHARLADITMFLVKLGISGPQRMELANSLLGVDGLDSISIC